MKSKTFRFNFNESDNLEDFLLEKCEHSLKIQADKNYLKTLKIRQLKGKVEIEIPLKDLKERKLPIIPAYELSQEEILFEDNDLLIINKPSGHPSQETLDPQRDHAHAMAIRYLGKKYKYLSLIHRLDVDTSGVLLMCKKKSLNAPLQDMFKQKTIQKTYLAISTSEKLPERKWSVKNYLKKEKGRQLKMIETKSGGDFAHTDFQLIQ